MSDRRNCQDYTKIAAKVTVRAEEEKSDVLKDIGKLLLFLGLFILASSIACPL